MRLPDFQYVEPKSLEEAALFLKDHGPESKIIAGGTDLLPSLKQRLFKPKYLVNLDKVPDLNQILFDQEKGLKIGAMVRLRSLEKDPVVLERYPVVAQAVAAVGSLQLREMGTVGGNLSLDTRCTYYNQSDFWRKCRPPCIKMGGEVCNVMGGGKKCFAVFSGDLAPALIALEGKIKLFSTEGERTVSLREYYTGNGAKPLTIRPEEILREVEVPIIPREVFSTYLKYRIRKSIDFPLAGVAAVLEMDRKEKVCRRAKVVINGIGTMPEEVKNLSDLLDGKRIENPDIEEASKAAFKLSRPVANTASTPTYRKKMIQFLVEKALKQGLKE